MIPPFQIRTSEKIVPKSEKNVDILGDIIVIGLKLNQFKNTISHRFSQSKNSRSTGENQIPSASVAAPADEGGILKYHDVLRIGENTV